MDAGKRTLLRMISEITREDDSDVSLAALARRSGWSPFHLQRRFRKFAGETPRQFAQRVRLDRAAAALVSGRASVIEVALDSGFDSHEVFSRAFRKRFGCSPREFRRTARLEAGQAARHSAIIRSVSPCVGLYRVSLEDRKECKPMPVPEIERRVLENEQPILFIRRRIPFAGLQQAMGESFGALYGHGQASGLAIASLPIARFVSTGTGLWTVDFIMPLGAPAQPNGEMQSGVLASGPVAFAVHHGPYDTLSESNAAIERWIENNGYEVGGPPWESYVTDPGETPNPADWRTEIYWPLTGGSDG